MTSYKDTAAKNSRGMAALDIERYRRLLRRIHETSGLTEMGVANRTGFDCSYICKIIQGHCLPPRDTLIVVCFYGYFLEHEQINGILEARGFARLPGRTQEHSVHW